MTEGEWHVCRDPVTMLDFLRTRGTPSPRKLRLFAVACSRRSWDHLDDLGRAAVELAEQYADDLTGSEELRAARLACKNASDNAAWYAAASSPVVAARNAALSAQAGLDPAVEPGVQADLLRCIFGTPSQSVLAINPGWVAWNDKQLQSVAQAIYQERAFDQYLALARLLEQAGCADVELLGHLRGGGPHARGCWCLDRLLHKTDLPDRSFG